MFTNCYNNKKMERVTMSDKIFISNDKISFICPFCNFAIPLNRENHSKYKARNNKVVEFQPAVVFSGNAGYNPSYETAQIPDEELLIEFKKCTNQECQKTNISIVGEGADVKELNMQIHPFGAFRNFPDYIPKSIIQDYREACAIVDLSPKASGTLSRRSLQSIIRDFWNIKNKNTLYEEIEAIKTKVAPQVWKTMDSLRSLGNIGAHSEKNINLIIDISPQEAKTLIKFIEYLIGISYIEKHETDILFETVQEINKVKQTEKKVTP